MATPAGPSAFEAAGEIVRSLMPDELGAFGTRAHRYGVKLWFGDTAAPARAHYEAQLVNGKLVAPGATIAVEVGFHAEHPDPKENDRVVAVLVAAEKKWRRALGPDAVAGPFLGRSGWRRVSETWIDADLGEEDLAIELAGRLVDYATAFEPVLRKG